MNNPDDFVIQDGILKRYKGSGGDIVIPESVTSIGTWAFKNCSGLKSVTIPNGVASINDCAFEGCNSLTSVTIPASITSIGDKAFSGCRGLTGVIIHDLSAWCRVKFEGSSSNPLSNGGKLYLDGELIENLLIPASVTSIGDYAFSACSSLMSVTIPDSVTTIGERVFCGCKSLTSITIPTSVTGIGYMAFYGCSGLTDVIIHDLAAWCCARFEDSSRNPLSNGGKLYLDGELIENLIIPASVTSIGDYAFSDCSSLKSVTIPESVTNVGKSAFSCCRGLKEVIIHDLAAWCSIRFWDYSSNPLSNGGKLYLDGELIENLVIPASVPSIVDYSFSACSSLTSVTIPSSVTCIGSNAFYHCSNLASVTIPVSITSIDESAFDGCSSLTSVEIPSSVTSIGDNAFSHCDALTSVTIPESVAGIGDRAFWCCSNLKSVTIQEGVTCIGKEAFILCYNLMNVTIPASVTSIEDGAFKDCRSLTSVTIPASVTTIGGSAFKDCTNLANVTILEGVARIGAWAFSGCNQLSNLIIPASVTSIGDGAFLFNARLDRITFDSVDLVFDGNPFDDRNTISIILPAGSVRTKQKLAAPLSKACMNMDEEDLAWIFLYQTAKNWRSDGLRAAKNKDISKILQKQLELLDSMKKPSSAAVSNVLYFCKALERDVSAEQLKTFALLLKKKNCTKQLAELEANLTR